jgi:hypothetical protein
MNGIPFEARQPGSEYRLANRPDDERTRVLSAFREYFNLCSEEKWLHDNRKLDRSTWQVWVRTMQVVAQFPCFVVEPAIAKTTTTETLDESADSPARTSR